MYEQKPATAAVPGSALVFKLLGDYFSHPVIGDGLVANEWWVQSARDKREYWGPFSTQYEAIGEMSRMVQEDKENRNNRK